MFDLKCLMFSLRFLTFAEWWSSGTPLSFNIRFVSVSVATTATPALIRFKHKEEKGGHFQSLCTT